MKASTWLNIIVGYVFPIGVILLSLQPVKVDMIALGIAALTLNAGVDLYNWMSRDENER
jgi:uncharacterized protein (DUF983 family)